MGRAIRAARAPRGLSQSDLADLCGIDRSYLGRVERGEVNAAFENLERIAAGLNVRLSDLLKSAGL